MKFCEIVTLLLHILYGCIVTGFYLAVECFFFVFQRKQKSVQDEIIVVTGAGHGLGRRIAINLSKLGAIVVCWDKNSETNTNTVWDIRHDGGKAHGYTCDVRDRQAVMDTADKVLKDVGPVSMLVNNAGIYLPVKAMLEWTPEQLKDVFETNIMAHFWTMKAFLPGMIERNHGHVVAMASAASIAPVAHEVPYSASKSAVTGLMDGMIAELRYIPNNKVKFTCVHPYYTAVREDIPVKFDLRIERLSPDYVAAEIIKGLLQEREMISVPRFMIFWITFMRCLPQSARRLWREDIFYTRVYNTEEDVHVKMAVSVEEKFRCAEKITGVESAVLPVTTEEIHVSMNGEQNNMHSTTEVQKNMMNAAGSLNETKEADNGIPCTETTTESKSDSTCDNEMTQI